MPPQNVGIAVAVVIAAAGNLPVEIIDNRDGRSRDDGRAIHLPKIYLSRRIMPPQNVGIAVAVVIAAAGYLPFEIVNDSNS